MNVRSHVHFEKCRPFDNEIEHECQKNIFRVIPRIGPWKNEIKERSLCISCYQESNKKFHFYFYINLLDNTMIHNFQKCPFLISQRTFNFLHF